MKCKLITIASAALIKGVTKQAAHQALLRGRLTRVLKDGKPFVKCDRHYEHWLTLLVNQHR